ncbi:helix-turn-helix domain-containing protein [Deinococcus sp.]|uniref:helix-turn-helix domain-containing protein n=1 Tax=Deinococcus sp. TaxID=47478 RepID=UPI003B596C06
MQLGERIRARRRHLGLTLKTVGQASGLSIAYLSQIERTQANPTVTALSSLARALGVKLSFFVPDETHTAVVVRKGMAAPLHLAELPYRVRSLAGRGEALQLEPLLIQIEPGFTSAPSSHLGEEFLHVLSGRLALHVGEECFDLSAGDSAQHPSTTPHAWANPGEQETTLLWVGTPRLF